MHKRGKTKYGQIKHYSVGIIIEKDNKILMIDRVNFPYGWACPAGHIDEDETPKEAVLREAKEEIGLKVKNLKFISEEPDLVNECSEGIKYHHFFGFMGKITGRIIVAKEEAKDWRWVEKENLKTLNLEPIWRWWFKKIGWLK